MKLNVRNARSIAATNPMAEAMEYMAEREEERTARIVAANDAVIINRLKALHDEVITGWSTASREAVEEYGMLIKALSGNCQEYQDEYRNIYGLYGLIWEMEMGLDA